MQSSSETVTTDKPTPDFLQAGCPSCRRTNSVKAQKGEKGHKSELEKWVDKRRVVVYVTFSICPAFVPGKGQEK